MGLDMYFYKKTYVKNWDHQSPDEKHEITVLKGGKPRTDIKPSRISYIVEDVGYWRKFNALHGWFVENCGGGEDNCQEMYVDPEKIKEINDLLKKVKAIMDNSKVSKRVLQDWSGKPYEHNVYDCMEEVSELLPPREGFFFGGTNIDEYFKNDVENSIQIFDEILNEVENNGYFDTYYRASW